MITPAVTGILAGERQVYFNEVKLTRHCRHGGTDVKTIQFKEHECMRAIINSIPNEEYESRRSRAISGIDQTSLQRSKLHLQ